MTPTGTIQMHTASSGALPVNCDVYDVGIYFPDVLPGGYFLPALPVNECPRLFGPINGLLGRDVIDRSVMTYNPFGGGLLTMSF
jgi:hypothetical protein